VGDLGEHGQGGGARCGSPALRWVKTGFPHAVLMGEVDGLDHDGTPWLRGPEVHGVRAAEG